MASENETLADIVAEMHRREKNHYYPKVARNIMHQYSGRIEAAWKREAKAIATEHAVLPAVCITKPSGNAAAMREALENAYSLLCEGIATEVDDGLEHPFHLELACEKIQNALSALPSNCDVGTAEEQAERCHAKGEVYHTLTLTNALEWAQMPYEAQEGGADGVQSAS